MDTVFVKHTHKRVGSLCNRSEISETPLEPLKNVCSRRDGNTTMQLINHFKHQQWCMSHTHKYWYQSCWSLSAATHLSVCVCESPSLAQLDCYSLCVQFCILYILKLCICMPYPTLCPVPMQVLSSWSPAGLCRISRGPSSKLSSGLLTVKPDTSSRMSSTETHTKAWGHHGANVHTHCVHQEPFPWKLVKASVKATSQLVHVYIVLDSFSCKCNSICLHWNPACSWKSYLSVNTTTQLNRAFSAFSHDEYLTTSSFCFFCPTSL